MSGESAGARCPAASNREAGEPGTARQHLETGVHLETKPGPLEFVAPWKIVLCSGKVQVGEAQPLSLDGPDSGAAPHPLSTSLGLLPHRLGPEQRDGGAVLARNVPARVINQGFREDLSARPEPAAHCPCSCCVRRDAGRPGPSFPGIWGGGYSPASSKAAPPNPRWEILAAGEKGAGRRGRRLPVGARTKPQLRLLCPFKTAFVPITSSPAAIWAEAARTAPGRGLGGHAGSLRSPGAPALTLWGPKFASLKLLLRFGGEWNP